MPTVTAAPLVFPPISKHSVDKVSLRATMRTLRCDLLASQGTELAEQLAQQAKIFTPPRAEAVVAGYWPLAHELDPRPLLWQLQKQGWILALPVIVGADQALLFRRYQSGEDLSSGPFGVQQPLDTAKEVLPDMVLVPLLAFDRHGHRLGYGGGFYDRTLAHLRQFHSIAAVGIALPQQMCDSLPTESTDQMLDAVLTPSELKIFCSLTPSCFLQ